MEEKTKNRIKRNALKCHSKSLHYIQSRMSIGTHQSWRIAKRFSSWHNVWKSQKKVSYNSANEASYIYIWSGQKFIQNAKNGQFGKVFENVKLEVKQCFQTGHFYFGQKLVEGAIKKTQMPHLGRFSNTVSWWMKPSKKLALLFWRQNSNMRLFLATLMDGSFFVKPMLFLRQPPLSKSTHMSAFICYKTSHKLHKL